MFETTLLDSTAESPLTPAGGRRAAALIAGVICEFTALGMLLVFPLIHTQGIDLKNLPAQEPLPPPPRAVKIVDVIRERSNRPAPPRTHPGSLLPPKVMPPRVGPVVDEPPPPAGPPDGIIGGIDLGPAVPSSEDSHWYRELARAYSPPPPPFTPKPQVRQRVGGEVQAARLIFAPPPEYPSQAKMVHVQGTVRLEAIIATDGRIQSLRVVSGHPLLVPAAIAAVSQWRYQPTLLNGEPAEVQTEIHVNFILGN
jgi:protein TonB